MKRALHVRKSTPNEVVMCELGQIPLHLFWRKLLLRFVGRLVDLPGHRLVKKAFQQAQQSCTPWFQKMSNWLHNHSFQGLLSDGTFSFSNARTTLRDTWFSRVCQSASTKVQCFIDSMHFDSDKMAPYLLARRSPVLFSIIKFRLGAHWLRVETDSWLPSKPPRDRRICQHCHMQAVEDEQHFCLTALFTNLLGNNMLFFLVMTRVAFASFWSAMPTKCPHLPSIFLCFQARMSDESHLAPHIWWGPGLSIILIEYCHAAMSTILRYQECRFANISNIRYH